MTTQPTNRSATVVLAGDWHGDTEWAKKCVWATADRDISHLVHHGDFGFWPGDNGVRYLDGVETACAAAEVTLSVIAGNHDDYNYLESLPADADGVTHPREHVRVLPRGYRFDLGGLSVCCVGGAVSVDKAGRTPSVSWWPQEEITDAQEAATIAGGPADILLTHDAPAGVATPKLPRKDFLNWVGAHIAAESDAHQNRVARIATATGARALVHGHFHARYTDHVTWTTDAGNTVECTVEGLACEHMDGNLVELTVADGKVAVAGIATPPHGRWRRTL